MHIHRYIYTSIYTSLDRYINVINCRSSIHLILMFSIQCYIYLSIYIYRYNPYTQIYLYINIYIHHQIDIYKRHQLSELYFIYFMCLHIALYIYISIPDLSIYQGHDSVSSYASYERGPLNISIKFKLIDKFHGPINLVESLLLRSG